MSAITSITDLNNTTHFLDQNKLEEAIIHLKSLKGEKKTNAYEAIGYYVTRHKKHDDLKLLCKTHRLDFDTFFENVLEEAVEEVEDNPVEKSEDFETQTSNYLLQGHLPEAWHAASEMPLSPTRDTFFNEIISKGLIQKSFIFVAEVLEQAEFSDPTPKIEHTVELWVELLTTYNDFELTKKAFFLIPEQYRSEVLLFHRTEWGNYNKPEFLIKLDAFERNIKPHLPSKPVESASSALRLPQERSIISFESILEHILNARLVEAAEQLLELSDKEQATVQKNLQDILGDEYDPFNEVLIILRQRKRTDVSRAAQLEAALPYDFSMAPDTPSDDLKERLIYALFINFHTAISLVQQLPEAYKPRAVIILLTLLIEHKKYNELSKARECILEMKDSVTQKKSWEEHLTFLERNIAELKAQNPLSEDIPKLEISLQNALHFIDDKDLILRFNPVPELKELLTSKKFAEAFVIAVKNMNWLKVVINEMLQENESEALEFLSLDHPDIKEMVFCELVKYYLKNNNHSEASRLAHEINDKKFREAAWTALYDYFRKTGNKEGQERAFKKLSPSKRKSLLEKGEMGVDTSSLHKAQRKDKSESFSDNED